MFLFMTEFAYNSAKKARNGHTFFKLNHGFYLQASYKKDINPYFQSKLVDKLVKQFEKLKAIYRKNLQYAQKLSKPDYNKNVKLKSYVPGKKVWFNSEYIKTKRNHKLEAKF